MKTGKTEAGENTEAKAGKTEEEDTEEEDTAKMTEETEGRSEEVEGGIDDTAADGEKEGTTEAGELLFDFAPEASEKWCGVLKGAR